MSLEAKIRERTAHVAVIGLGYVGIPVAVAAADAGFKVTGFDIDPVRTGTLASGRSTTADVADGAIALLLREGRFLPTSDPTALAGADIFVICVPTPLKQELPDMAFVEAASKTIAAHLQPERLVILESTSYPGTTEEFVQPILESGGLMAGTDFALGFSPERIDPGNESYGLGNVPKIVGGIDPNSTELMVAFYSAFVEKVLTVSSPMAAEMTKLLENTYRHINIALANEMAILCHELGIDIWEVIDAAATKPFGFQAFYPGPGWGGHCIPVDPAYLSWRVRQFGDTARFVELAREINARMPAFVLQRITECLNDQNKSVRDSKVLILGIAYKADVADTRGSPALEIMERLERAGAKVSFHDPLVNEIGTKNGNLEAVELEVATVAAADVVVVVTDHSGYDWQWIAEHADVILDTRNAMAGVQGGRVYKL